LPLWHEDVWGSGGIAPCILTSALHGSERLASRLDLLIPGLRSVGTHWIEGWAGLRAGLDVATDRKIFALSENRTPVVQPIA
jgi:hypothetical protein